MVYARVFVVFLICIVNSSFSQKLEVRSGFLADSLRVGDEVYFYLALEYPSEKQVVFPDSTYSYTPFEYIAKRYFPTKTNNNVSYDSAVYSLTTFEVDAFQTLRLPVFVVNSSDCTKVYSRRDTIRLERLVRQLPDSLTSDLPLRATIAYQKVRYEFNWQLLIVGLSLLVLAVGIVWVLFAPQIKRHLFLRRLSKMHRNFLASYQQLVLQNSTTFSVKATEDAMTLWKRYMEGLTRKPYTKLTTKEMWQLEKDETLAKNLRYIDGAIYGSNTYVAEPLDALGRYAVERFNKIMKEANNGK